MVYKVTQKQHASTLFEGWQETMIWLGKEKETNSMMKIGKVLIANIREVC